MALIIDTAPPLGAQRASWQMSENLPVDERIQAPTFDQGISTLFRWGSIDFRIWPFNVNEIEHDTGSDWAQKEIAGAAIYREWVGENDETLHLRGEFFPYRIGGMSDSERFDAARRQGTAAMLVRGHGEIIGWFVCETFTRKHQHLSAEGVGQQVSFEATMVRVPIPAADDEFTKLWSVMVANPT